MTEKENVYMVVFYFTSAEYDVIKDSMSFDEAVELCSRLNGAIL